MGMFDYVHMIIKCPRCGEKVSGFQSKSGDCCLRTLEFWEVDYFYSDCEKCECYIQFEKKENVRKKLPISAYKMNSYSEFVPYKGHVGEKEHNPEDFIMKKR